MKNLTIALSVTVLFLSAAAFAEEPANPAVPKITISASEGYLVLFKDGTATPGSATTRYGLTFGWAVAPKTTVSVTVGANIPNAEFKPLPRAILGAGYALTDKMSVVAGVLYQLNYGYSGAKTTHLLGGSLGARVKIGNGLALGLDLGPAKVLQGRLWSLLFQPGISYTF